MRKISAGYGQERNKHHENGESRLVSVLAFRISGFDLNYWQYTFLSLVIIRFYWIFFQTEGNLHFM